MSSRFSFFLLMTGTAGATNYTLTVSAQGSGTVTRNPTNSTYPSGVTVIVTATPNAGWYFANWSGDANGSVNPLNVVMNTNLVITGNFLAFPHLYFDTRHQWSGDDCAEPVRRKLSE